MDIEEPWGETFDITDTTDAELVDSRQHTLNCDDREGDLTPLIEALSDEEGFESDMKSIDRAVRMFLVYLLREEGIEDKREEFGLNTSLPPLEMEFDPIEVAVDKETVGEERYTPPTTEGVRAYLQHYLYECDDFPYDQQNNFVGDAVRWRVGRELKYY